jgi:hypothetical protein
MLLGVALGCDAERSLLPTAIAGTYVLARVDNSALPAVLYPGNFTGTVFADTFRLGANLRGTRTTVIRWDDVSRQTTGNVVRQHEDYVYRVTGSTFELTFVCPPNALCTEPQPLRTNLTADGLRISSGSPIVPLLYIRVD